uniref:Neural cell adhesion molecule L1 n=1 Tax=Dicentrarchus labrax TaxID=13489 RepID=A0A8P4K617_DICLA
MCVQVVVYMFVCVSKYKNKCVFFLTCLPLAPPTQQKEKKVSLKAEEGNSMVLKCNPPQSSMEPIIHWMDWRLHHILLSERVVVGKDGNLYFAYLTTEDSRDDYTCNVQYLATRTILAKEPITLTVNPSNSVLRNRRPHMMRPTESHSTYHALRGQTIELECIVQGLPTPKVSWLRKDGELFESRTTKEMFNRRLRFSNISESDGGEYQCIAENSQGKATHTYFVTVEASPYWTIEPVSQLYAPGETVKLDCQADGIPSPTISWTINGIPLSGKRSLMPSGSLILEDVNFGDTAIYQCQASNKHGTILTNANVYVIELPPQILTEDGNQYTVAEGQKASLECETFGSPKPKVVVVMILLLTLDRPDPPVLLQITDPKHRAVTLSWTPGDDHNSPVLEYVIEFEDQALKQRGWEELKKVGGNKKRASLTLWPYMSYRFRVIAINDVDKSDPSKPSEIHNTPAEAPDNNPEDVRSESTDPDTLVITWEDMDKRNFNGPNFKYRVLWRRVVGSGPNWHTNYTTAPPFTVNDIGNFSAFEIKVQAVNEEGDGPEPDPVIGYSGEDFPLEAPMDVGVVLMNSTTIRVTWAAVDKETVRGHLLGYKVLILRTASLSLGWVYDSCRRAKESESTVVVETGANEEKKVISDLRPYSHYTLAVTVFNSKGEGPPSEPLSFKTEEGVPGPPTSLMLDSPSETEMTLHWTPPGQPNGVLIGYLLQYQQSEHFICAGGAAHTSLQITCRGVKSHSLLYVLYLVLFLQGSKVTVITFRLCHVSADGGNWKKTEKVNSSQSFYQLQGLTPGSHYRLRFSYSNTTFWETDIDTEGTVTEVQPSFATQGWFIGVVSAIVLLLLILLILCFIKRSKGGKYSVKDKEEGPMDSEARPMKDETFGEYSDLEEKRTASQPSLGEESKLCSEDNLDFNGSSAITTELNMDESLASQFSRPSEGPDGLRGIPDNSPLNPNTISPATNGMPNSVTILD